MRWARINIKISNEAEDAVSNLLMEIGSGGVQIDDEGNNSMSLKAYFPTDDMIGQHILEIQKLLGDLRGLGINVGAGKITIDSIDEKEWTEPWKEFFKPLSIGKRIVVFPSWEKEELSSERDILIQIDPGMAFGSGRHSTSILCLELLEENIKGGENVLDIGTGSGILSIGAVKLGAARVLAVDVDERAVFVAKENFQSNNVDDKAFVLCSDGLNSVNGKYEIIVVNISAKIIVYIIPLLTPYLNPNGKLILSGILDTEAFQIQEKL